jgi:hypothetical protein
LRRLRVVSFERLPAAVAAPQDGEVVGADIEAILGPGGPSETIEELCRRLDHRRACFADEMAVSEGGEIEHRRAVTEMGVDHDSGLFEFVEVPVDGGHVDVGSDLVNFLREFLRGPVSRVVVEGV